MSNLLLKKKTLSETLLKFYTRHLHLHSICICIFNLNSGKYPKNGSINIKADVTITKIYAHQSTEETQTENTPTNDREKRTLMAILLGTFIPICVLFVLYGYFSFHKRRKIVYCCSMISYYI